MKDSVQEVAFTIEQVQQLFRDLTVGGLLTADTEKINTLRTLYEEFSKIGAPHIAENLKALLGAIEANSRESAVLLMRAQASIRLFDRILTLEHAVQQVNHMIAYDQFDEEEDL